MEAATHIHCLSCERLRKALESMEIDLQNAEVGLRVERRKTKALKGELAQQRKQAPEHDLVVRLFDYWKMQLNKARSQLTEDREKKILARLRDGYHPRDIAEAILGAKYDAFVSEKGIRYDDLALVCESGQKLENFMARYHAWRRNQGGAPNG